MPGPLWRFYAVRGTVCPRIPVPVGPQVRVGHKRNWHEIWPVGLKQQPLCSEGGLEGTLVAHTRYHSSASSPGGWGQQLDPQLLQLCSEAWARTLNLFCSKGCPLLLQAICTVKVGGLGSRHRLWVVFVSPLHVQLLFSITGSAHL